MAILRERITFGEAAELSGGFSDEMLVAEMTRMVGNYLTNDKQRVVVQANLE
jgi:hypothetical protein